MKYDRYFLENVHNDIKAYMAAMDLEPHRRPQNLISHLAVIFTHSAIGVQQIQLG